MQWTVLALAGVAWNAQAQQTCPELPAGAPLSWEQQPGSGFLVCRAVATDGRQVFGVMLTDKPTISPRRRNRQEEGRIGSHEMYWYEPDIAVSTGEEKRVTVIELGKDRYAQIWVDAPDPEALQRSLALAQGIALD
ncbi:hypothetical protein [Xanthomonas sp. XNM01]|uniref:hypothetical protein n=1 Tax=Xanthomonas sp. XNM01 TaxID=2769289 RepID=UPI0031BB20FE